MSGSTINSKPDSSRQNLTDAALWASFQEGDDGALACMYNHYFQSLFNYGCHISLDKELVRDSIQDVFIELAHRREHLGKVRALKGYLLTCLKRKILHNLKKERPLIPTPHPEPQKDGFQAVPFFEANTNYEAQERRQKLTEAINHLSKRQREAIYLFYFENLTYEEVKQVMALDHVKSARNIIYKALHALRRNAGALVTGQR